jgi:hypothetical protein
MRAVLRLIRVRRRVRPQALALGLLLAAATSAQAGAAAQAPTKFEGDSLPDPPQQNVAWEPPQAPLPEKLIAATAKLFEQGLADPRGCEYREVEVASGTAAGGARRIKTHAWVLPAAPQPGGRRFAVGWNGLVYPLESVGEKADLRQDVLALIMKDERMLASWRGAYPIISPYNCCASTPNFNSLSHQWRTLIKAPMLLRLGEGELARKVWDDMNGGTSAEANDDGKDKDPYLLLAYEWTWALFDRALTAHVLGDDRLSLLSARALVPIRDAVESEAASRQLPPPVNALNAHGEWPRYLPFLRPLPALLADQERRAREGGRGMPSLRDRLTNRRVRVADVSVDDLIRNLDEARGTLLGLAFPQFKQFDAVIFGGDAVVNALIEKGDEAVEPLLRVLEDDTRLIRTVRFRQDNGYERHMIGVQEAAYAALAVILKSSPFGGVTPDEELRAPGMERRRALAARVRLYLKQYGSLPPEERWYRALADDGSTLEQWQQAAIWIATRADYRGTPTTWVESLARFRRKGESVALRGEALRQKAAPSVSKLLARRVDDSLAHLADEDWPLRLRAARNFTVALAAWDGTGGLGELRRVTALLERLFEGEKARATNKRSWLIGDIIGIHDERQALGDPRAVAEYAGWLRTIRPEDTDYRETGLFNFASRYADSPEIAEAVTRMFGGPSPPWGPVVGKLGDGPEDTLYLLETGLLVFPVFRARVLEGLADRRVVGTLKPRSADPAGAYDPKVEFELKVENLLAAAAAGETQQPDAVVRFTIGPRSLAPSMSAPVSFRACDVYAWKLRGFEGAPWIELYWSEEARDSAVASSAKFLREHNGPFVYSEERAYSQP